MPKPPQEAAVWVEAQFCSRAPGLSPGPAGAKPKVPMATCLSTPVGMVHRGDLLLIKDGAGFRAAFAKLFFRVPGGDFAAFVEVLRQVQGVHFSAAADCLEKALVRAEHILGAFPYLLNNDQVYCIASGDVFSGMA
jgi:hypothetical protein